MSYNNIYNGPYTIIKQHGYDDLFAVFLLICVLVFEKNSSKTIIIK